MNFYEEVKKSTLTSLWFVFLTFPIMVIKVNTIEKTVEWRWINILLIALGGFTLSFIWRYLMLRKKMGGKQGGSIVVGMPLAMLMFLLFSIFLVLGFNIYRGNPFGWNLEQAILIGVVALLFLFRKFFLNWMARHTKSDWGRRFPANGEERLAFFRRMAANPSVYRSGLSVVALVVLLFPFVSSVYQTNIVITALIWVMLGLGLNIVVGLAGLLDIGYVAFYAVGAYGYALLNAHFEINFWIALPIGGVLGALFGILLGYPVLRLRGDYLAIVTLGFGEIIRLVLENWNEFSFGPSGIANIPKPTRIPGFDESIRFLYNGWDTFTKGLSRYVELPEILLVTSNIGLKIPAVYIYFLMVLLTAFTIFIVNRLQDSRIGRAWIALREDEVACQSMGIDKWRTKLSAFAMGATWAGMAGVMFAAKTTFINPQSFTIWESVMILCIVVLGGMGSIFGVILGAFVLILLPEYLRAFSEFRMLIFGAIMVLMMVFRPGGIITSARRTYQYRQS